MVCKQCGCELGVGAQFCPGCGARFEPAAPQPAWVPTAGRPAGPYLPEQRQRVRQNLQPLGILWCLFGVYRLVRGIAAATILGAMARGGAGWFGDAPAFLPHLFGVLAPVIAVTSAVMALVSLVTGYGLLTQKPWGRVLGIVMGILTLIKLPVGTALGIYTLWVLAPAASGVEWESGRRVQERNI